MLEFEAGVENQMKASLSTVEEECLYLESKVKPVSRM